MLICECSFVPHVNVYHMLWGRTEGKDKTVPFPPGVYELLAKED